MNYYTNSVDVETGNRLGVEPSNCISGGSFFSVRGSFVHLTADQTRDLIADLQATLPTFDFIGGFNEGDIVRGPFIINGETGETEQGLGLVTAAAAEGYDDAYVPVQVLVARDGRKYRNSGGYGSDELTLVKL